jgi:hypothetical protein
VELDPEDTSAYIIYVDVMKAAGRIGEARVFLEELARRHPDLPGPRLGLERLSR